MPENQLKSTARTCRAVPSQGFTKLCFALRYVVLPYDYSIIVQKIPEVKHFILKIRTYKLPLASCPQTSYTEPQTLDNLP